VTLRCAMSLRILSSLQSAKHMSSKSRVNRSRRNTFGATACAFLSLLCCIYFASYFCTQDLDHKRKLTLDKRSWQKTHVFMATDNPDVRPLLVVVNSTLNSPTNSESIVMIVIVPPELADRVKRAFQRLFPGFKSCFIIDSESFESQRVARLPGVSANRKTKRTELANPYNFAAFYIAAMPKYAHITKAIYLDIDTVVQGDLHELLEYCCEQNTPLAVVEDCSQRAHTYINTSELTRALSQETVPSVDDTIRLAHIGEACVFNRGVLVLNLPIWREMNITKQIESWMSIYDAGGGALYFQGVSQPPFILALVGRYTRLDARWNVRGLSRTHLDQRELKELRFRGVSDEYFRRVGLHGMSPFVSPFSAQAKILHFNGKCKPWRADICANQIVAVCGDPPLPCALLWWKHFSEHSENIF